MLRCVENFGELCDVGLVTGLELTALSQILECVGWNIGSWRARNSFITFAVQL